MIFPRSPLEALRFGQWFKLICGASYQDVSRVRNLALVYSLAGVDCIDLAADLAIVHAARQGILAGQEIVSGAFPLVMVSFNDGKDPHFRKAWFDVQNCPVNCPRPCQMVCPADAISPVQSLGNHRIGSGVLSERCYGCGRCLPVCPHNVLEERSFQVAVNGLLPELFPYIDAVEIHTQVGHQAEFLYLWGQLSPYVSRLKLVAVSCPDSVSSGGDVVSYLAQLFELMEPRPRWLIWQTDGRSMSGDIGKGTTHAAIRLAQKVLNSGLPGYVQLAGGTNDYTVAKLQSLNLLQGIHRSDNQCQSPSVHGIAYGSYARSLVDVGDEPLEECPEELWRQVSLASDLVSQIKPGIQYKKGISRFLKKYGCEFKGAFVGLPP